MAVVRGTVIDASGAPVAGARVMLAQSPAGAPDVALLTGPDGSFALGAPAAGRYVIEAYDDSRGRGTADLEVSASSAAELRAVVRLPR